MSCALIILYLFCILRLPLTYLYLHTYTKRNRDLYQFRCLSLDFQQANEVIYMQKNE